MRFVLLIIVLLCGKLFAFPTSLYWTPCITDVVPTCHVEINTANYFTIFNREGRGQAFPFDFGVTYGLFTCGKLAGEVGFDYLGATDHPFFFNAKVRLDEHALDWRSPSFSVGIFDVGTSSETSLYVVDVVAGKTLWDQSRIFVGAYWGQHIGKTPGGFMVGYLKGFCHFVDCYGKRFAKWTFLADFATGKNVIGGGGFGLQYALNSRVAFIFGPTWFNDARINGRWKWTFQTFFLIPIRPETSSTDVKKKEVVTKKKEQKDVDKKEVFAPKRSAGKDANPYD